MKNILRSAFWLLPSLAFAQGGLTPPGPPAPTMKALDQLEPRTLIAGGSNAVSITQPGSYYLGGNMTVISGNAITIATNGVTLDLMGFTITSTANPAAGNGIFLNGSIKNITILNGGILGAVTYNGSSYTGAGFQNGINGANPRNVRISGVSVAGCTLNGIFLGTILQSSDVVDHCLVRTVGNTGIQAGSVSDCVVSECGGAAISCFIANNSSGDSTGSLTGVSAKTAVNCVGASATGTGLNADSATGCRGESTALSSTATGLNAATATSCYGYNGNGSGIGLSATIASGCYGFSSGGNGLNATTAIGCFGQSATSGIGILADDVSNSSGNSGSNIGLSAINASTCTGTSSSYFGLFVPGNLGYGTAAFCRGVSSTSYGLVVHIAIGCTAAGSPPRSTAYPYLMP
jgi:hypothetical protein